MPYQHTWCLVSSTIWRCKIEVLRRTFFWQGNEDKRKYYLFKREEMNISKKVWASETWNFRTKALWWSGYGSLHLLRTHCGRKWLLKYGMRDKWMSTKVTSPYGSSVWRSINDLWDLVLKRSYCKVGNGRKVAFWMDKWCGQVPLSQRFPDLSTYVKCNKQL